MQSGNPRLQLPVRNNLFYSERDYQYEVNMMDMYLEEDLNQLIVVYEVDRSKTTMNALYKESQSGSIRFKSPREIPCQYEIAESQIKSFDDKSSNGVYSQDGNLTVNLLVRTLEKYRVDISRGDYIGVPVDTNRMKYYTVIDDGKTNSSNNKYIGSFHPAWRKIECAPVGDISEFNG